ncbi:ribonuclease D [Colwellia sp. MB02u-18]|nr:ribonuclease D [Colwellia sp. MB3u-45]MBA6266177.1 ribonuclease D [Colwellia sp. MB3u-43]MBA6319653.1 ribonuclease D [Colwellia sp. MB02u-19]MBA6324261.1 ribonuclease D [Colwellia sp. MB02u-18]MBA6329947.1 ribonuclease D [Colwellia sp. MB02u-12]MBA6343253.1 ribonuclease D [Colwellia sp. MB02u-1]
MYVEYSEQLHLVCQRYSQASVLAIDTEFVRTRTLYPKLGLIQINDGKTLALIDPVALPDLSPFWQLLENPNVQKVLHACSEDLEVFLTAGNCQPLNLIDSQIIMSFLGHGISMGYAAMIAHYTGIEVDKSESRADWMKRPLTQKQLSYAAADVEHLFDIMPRLMADIEQSGWLAAVKEESDVMVERKFKAIDESQLYLNVKMAWRLNPPQLYRLQQLTIWRYQQAKLKDRPIGFIAKDHTLLALAQINPSNVGAMSSIEGVELLDIRHKGNAMLTVLKRVAEAQDIKLPKQITRLDEYPGYKQNFKKVKNYINELSTQTNLLTENLASKKQINQFLSWHFKLNDAENNPNMVDIMRGWRKPLLGDKLLAFVENDFQ